MSIFAFKASAGMRQDSLVLETSSGAHTIQIEVAETSRQKALGLMFRTSLPDTHGMLFPYDAPQEVTMWMRNTYIPLDMIFIRQDGTVHRIEAGAEPMSERIISSDGAVTGVLELAAGAAARLGVKPGDKVRYGFFENRK
jgi:uncharacterized membrane protein (UPF0127 family)